MLGASVAVTASAPKPTNTVATDKSADLSASERMYSPPSRGAMRNIFRAGWILAVFIVLGSLIGGFVYVHSRNQCVARIADTARAGVGSSASDRCITVERVSTDAAIRHGLSDRAGMPKNHGMLFVFDQAGKQCFWMKDMHFNLDILWINSAKQVVHVEHDLSPNTYPNTYCPDVAAQYVLEVNSGIADAAHLQSGAKLNL